jgi:hypothetical protein
MLLVAHPAIMSVFRAEAVFGGVAVAFEQERLFRLDRIDVVGMHAGAPEGRILEIFVRAIAEQALDVLADEGRRVIAARLEAVDHRWRAIEQERKPFAGPVLGQFGGLARADVAPRAHHLRQRALLVTDEMLVVVHPAIGAVFAPEAIFDRVVALFEQGVHFALDARKIIGMHALTPEIRVFEIFASGISEQPHDVLADKARREIALCLEAIDYRRRGFEQPGQSGRGRSFDFSQMLALVLVSLARRVGQDTLEDIGHFARIGAGWQHFTKRRGSNLGVFSGRGH